jgi:hypothetical protein
MSAQPTAHHRFAAWVDLRGDEDAPYNVRHVTRPTSTQRGDRIVPRP